MGGVLGGCPALGIGTEHQGVGTPHGHGEAHFTCIYQYGTLKEIADKIEQKLFDPQTVKAFQAWLHREEPMDAAQHDEEASTMYTEWQQRYAGEQHAALCTTPEYMLDDSARTMWHKDGPSQDEAMTEGATFKRQYFADVQFVFSGVQEHFHKPTKNGLQPLSSCLSKRCKKKCKAGFPKTKQLNNKIRVICRGNAGRFGLRVSGRRISFGSLLGKRSTSYQSGTCPPFAAAF